MVLCCCFDNASTVATITAVAFAIGTMFVVLSVRIMSSLWDFLTGGREEEEEGGR